MSIVNNAVSYVSNFAQSVDCMSSALPQKEKTKQKEKQEHKETLGGIGYNYNVN